MTIEGKARIVSVKILMLAAVLAAVVSGAGSVELPRLTAFNENDLVVLKSARNLGHDLDEAARRGYLSWSHYASARYRLNGLKDRAGCGRELIEAMVLNPESGHLRRIYGEYLNQDLQAQKQAWKDYERVYRVAPQNLDVICYYLELLRSGEKHEEAGALARKLFDETGQSEGRLLLEWILSKRLDGNTEGVEALLKVYSENRAAKNRWAVQIGEACWLLGCMQKLEVKEKTQKSQAGNQAGEAEAVSAVSDKTAIRDRILRVLDRISPREVNERGQLLVCVAYSTLGEWKKLSAFLLEVTPPESRLRRWWMKYLIQALSLQGDYETLYDELSRQRITAQWHTGDLKAIVNAYMARPGHLQDAIRIQMLVFLSSGNQLGELLYLCQLLLAGGRYAQGYALIMQVPVGKLPFHGRMVRNRLMQKMGKLEEAYRDLAGMNMESKLWLGFKRLPPVFYMEYSSLCLKMKKEAEALNLAEEGWKKNKNDDAVSNFYGYVLADLGIELDKAETLIRTALKAEPGNIAYIDSLAWVKYRKGDLCGALKEISKILEKLHGDAAVEIDAEIAQHISEIFKALGLGDLAALWANRTEAALENQGTGSN